MLTLLRRLARSGGAGGRALFGLPGCPCGAQRTPPADRPCRQPDTRSLKKTIPYNKKMQSGVASRTALRVAIRRAAHQLVERPRILDDPLAIRLVGPGFERDLERAMHPIGRDFRAFMAVRSRFVEDRLAAAVAVGLTQYVLLGAGLDSFAYRNPHPGLAVFEVDHPATQQWKRSRLAEAGIAPPASLTFVALDFERRTLAEGLAGAGFDFSRPALFAWMGVVPYLTLAAFRATLSTITGLPAGSGLVFDYVLPPESYPPARRRIFERLRARVAAAGEPFRLFFSAAGVEVELHAAGFRRTEQADAARLNELYFRRRADGLRLSADHTSALVAAWL